jgi:NAD(P)-dependent dehydrogenase (short-subunit alcohol dehydrogenase family)
MPGSSEGRFEGKIAMVTGAASGIGLSIATRLVEEGATVFATDIAEDNLASAAAGLGDRYVPLRADVTNEADIEAATAAAVAAHGGLDLGFNVAGIADLAFIVDMSAERWDKVIAVTLRGVFLGLKHQARAITAGPGKGAIVNIASINCSEPTTGLSAYSTAKAGVQMLTRSAAVELGPQGIRVNAVSPGLVDTPATAFFAQGMPEVRQTFLDTIPLGRTGTPGDIASAATYLASEDAAWISGANLYVDGGESLAGYPDLMKMVGGVPTE